MFTTSQETNSSTNGSLVSFKELANAADQYGLNPSAGDRTNSNTALYTDRELNFGLNRREEETQNRSDLLQQNLTNRKTGLNSDTQSVNNTTSDKKDTITGLVKTSSLVTRTTAPRANNTVYGSLASTDALNPTRSGSYKDDYLYRSSTTGTVQLNMNSSQFDTYLQVVNASTGQVVAYDDDSGPGVNSQVSFTATAGTSYLVRATSYSAYATGTYDLTARANSSSPPPSSGRFNSTYGYGLVNAAAAVARSINTSTFRDVADLGGNNWGNDSVKAPEVWARGYTGRNVVVAVVDSGVDHTHSDLDGNIWTNSREIAGNGIDDDRNGYIDDVRGWDFVNNDNNATDDNGHGTHVAGTIAAENNGVGLTGVAYGAKIMPIKVLSSSGSGTNQGVANGIRYAANNGAKVINLSLGGGYSSVIESAIQYATQRGAIVVMAAGNEGTSQPGYPAHHATQYGLSVGAVDRNRTIASFSNRAGSNSQMQHVVAPGVSIYSTLPGNRYGLLNGTSMATPHVAGVVALMLSANSSLTPTQVRQYITGSATTLSSTAATSSSSVLTHRSSTQSSIMGDASSVLSTTVPSSTTTQSLQSELSTAISAASGSTSQSSFVQPEPTLRSADPLADQLTGWGTGQGRGDVRDTTTSEALDDVLKPRKAIG
jgi:subtilisin family serine protease